MCVCGGSCISVMLYIVLHGLNPDLRLTSVVSSAQVLRQNPSQNSKIFWRCFEKIFPVCAAVVTVTGWEDTRHCAGFRDGPRLHSQEIELIAKSVSMDFLRLDIFQTSENFCGASAASQPPTCPAVSVSPKWNPGHDELSLFSIAVDLKRPLKAAVLMLSKCLSIFICLLTVRAQLARF